MSKTTDWVPSSRSGITGMMTAWSQLLTTESVRWGIAPGASAELESFFTAAKAALATAENESTRTPVATARCRDAFGALVGEMRDFKRRFFLTPPLVDADYIALGLKPRDTILTPSGAPTAQVTIETFLVGRHEMGIRIVYLTGNPDDPANKGYRIWYSVVPPGGAAPATPEELRKSYYTRRKKDVLGFDYADSGSTCYMAVQVENEGKKGPWGPLVSALIP